MPTIDRTHGWGHRSQIGATIQKLDALEARKSAHGNVPVRVSPHAVGRNPAWMRFAAAASVGVSTKDEIARLGAFRAQREKEWGAPVMDPAIERALNGGALFAAQKAIDLAALGLAPSQVLERFVEASGVVDGKQIPPARILTQHWLPQGKPTGDVVVMGPGFLETGRAFLDEIAVLVKHGVHVVTFDHQWAGQTQGRKGGIESGESIALHHAAVCADAFAEGEKRYGPAARLTAVGESMGGGPGAFGAALAANNGLLQLDGGARVPPHDVLAQAPYFGPTPNLVNGALGLAAGAPLLNRIAMPGIGVPDFVDDTKGEALVAQAMVLEDVRGRLQAFKASDPWIARLDALVDQGKTTGGRLVVIHDQDDPLADFAKSAALTQKAGGTLLPLGRGNHGLSASDAGFCAQAILDVLGIARQS